MEVMNQHTYRLDKVQRATKAALPGVIERLLEEIARQGIHPHLLFQHYTTVFDRAESQKARQAAQAPQPTLEDPSSPEGHYGCPWCSSMIKLEKDFIRHVKEKCCAEIEYRCPDCSKTYTRKHRLANHHKNIHPNRCGPGSCTHVHSAAIKLKNAETLGCGFCPQLFHNDLHGYLRHVIDHYRGGAMLATWQAGPHIPSPNGNARPFSPPPRIKLSSSLEEQSSTSDFSALRSGFGLQDESPCRADSAVSNDSTLFDMSGYMLDDTSVKGNWDPFFNPSNIDFLASQYQPQSFDDRATHYEAQHDDFENIFQYLNHDPTVLDDTIIPQSAAVADACAQLMDIDTLPFNPTPPLLDLSKDRRRSMSGRLLKKFQSLSPLRTEF